MSWRRLPITQVDAFADRPFTGNPAAVMPLEEWLDDATLQAIAAENNLAETAFLIPDESGEADYELRWFTPGVAVALCGRSEEHTSELQSLMRISYAVFCLKKIKTYFIEMQLPAIHKTRP